MKDIMRSLLRYVALSVTALSCAPSDPEVPLDDFSPTWRAASDAGRENDGEAPFATGNDADGRPVPICNAMDFGAKRDGKSNDTRALQSAIDACAKSDRGGVVLLEGGTFLSGTIRLADRISFRIAKGATLLGSREDRDYPELVVPTDNSQLSNCKRALVYVGNAHHVRIEGEGTIDGNADIPKWRGGTVAESSRPMAIFAALSERVTIEGIRVRNAATWAVVGLETNYLTIRGLDVSTDLGPTHDGIDVVDGHDIVMKGAPYAAVTIPCA
jgi:polygalacturonase